MKRTLDLTSDARVLWQGIVAGDEARAPLAAEQPVANDAAAAVSSPNGVSLASAPGILPWNATLMALVFMGIGAFFALLSPISFTLHFPPDPDGFDLMQTFGYSAWL